MEQLVMIINLLADIPTVTIGEEGRKRLAPKSIARNAARYHLGKSLQPLRDALDELAKL